MVPSKFKPGGPGIIQKVRYQFWVNCRLNMCGMFQYLDISILISLSNKGAARSGLWPPDLDSEWALEYQGRPENTNQGALEPF